MIIPAIAISETGSGVDLSNQPDGFSIEMSDPVTDSGNVRNEVTLTFDLSGAESARLSFRAMGSGNEPHEPRAEPFVDDVDFDGVAISVDGVDWYEVQDLRSLRSDRFAAYDLDLNTIVARLGLAFGSAFRIRFCQHESNPARQDWILFRGIEVAGDLRPAILHLTMDDNAGNPTVRDSSTGHHDQIFVDPGGNPNTEAHSVPGVVGTALSFNGVDDQIDLGSTVDAALKAGHDFAVVCWWARGAGNNECNQRIFNIDADNGNLFAVNASSSGSQRTVFHICRSLDPEDRTVLSVSHGGYDWKHYVFQRRGKTFEVWANGVLLQQNTTAGNERDFSGPSGFVLGGYGSGCTKGTMDDFRVYDRALLKAEIEGFAEIFLGERRQSRTFMHV